MTGESRVSIRVSHRYDASPERVYDAWLAAYWSLLRHTVLAG